MKHTIILRMPLLLMGWFGTIAVAQPALSPSPPPAADPAEQAYQRGRGHYDLREWDEAIAEFKEAYRLRQDPASLFNIAQSYRLKGDCAEAASFYKTYRRNFPNEKNVARAEEFIAEMDECATKPPITGPGTTSTGSSVSQTSAPGAVTTGAPSGSATPPPTPAAPGGSKSQQTLAHVGIGVAGAGVACVVGAVLFGIHARSIEDDVMQLPRWDPDLNERGERADLATKILYGAGGAMLIGGGVLIWLGYRQPEHAATTSLRVAPHPHGATLSWSGAF